MTRATPVDQALVDHVSREVADLLDAGRVGLYEFVWIARQHAPTMDEPALREHARAALTQVLEREKAVLAWQVWGHPDRGTPAAGAIPRDEDWATPTDAPYLAVVPL